MTRQRNTPKSRKPRILVLEGLRDAASAIRAAGGEAIIASPRTVATADKEIAGKFDGLVLTGGGDLSPELYGQKPHRKVYGVSAARDYVEWAALDRARELDAAVLGICRGMQMIAVHNGGVLKQHIEGHRNTIHPVHTQAGSTFRAILQGSSGTFTSLHHQRVTRHGPDFRVGGRCADGKIEAIESKDGRVLGVQFHPEMDASWNLHSQLIFRWLVIEAAKRAGLAIPPVPKPPRRAPLRPVEQAAEPANRTINQPVVRRTPRRPVASIWFCRHCGMQFDTSVDRDDHEYWVCGTPEMRTTEPPPGHPDWIDPDPKTKKGSK